MLTYGRLRNVDYEDSESSNLLLDVETSGGIWRVLVDENNLFLECCSPKVYKLILSGLPKLNRKTPPFQWEFDVVHRIPVEKAPTFNGNSM